MSKIGLPLLLTLFLFIGCGETDETAYLGSWVEMKQTSTEGLLVNLRMEDRYGNCPSGARVYLLTPEGEILWIPFSREFEMYSTTLSDILSGVYQVEIESYFGNRSYSIPMRKLEQKPSILDIRNS